MKVSAIILARGGSKGIPNKNLINICGKPLLSWTIENCLNADLVNDIWVSSDSEEILDLSKRSGANTILRPANISGDTSSSESGWIHAVNYIEEKTGKVDCIIAPQATSPLRTALDINLGIKSFFDGGYDSLFSCSIAEDLFLWEKDKQGDLFSINYNFKSRQRRQDLSEQFIENGSFYIFTPETLENFNNRFGNNIGTFIMESWKMYEIDTPNDLRICETLMKEFLLP
jgi:N-acylneuraminate cytidylyltransferase